MDPNAERSRHPRAVRCDSGHRRRGADRVGKRPGEDRGVGMACGGEASSGPQRSRSELTAKSNTCCAFETYRWFCSGRSPQRTRAHARDGLPSPPRSQPRPVPPNRPRLSSCRPRVVRLLRGGGALVPGWCHSHRRNPAEPPRRRAHRCQGAAVLPAKRRPTAGDASQTQNPVRGGGRGAALEVLQQLVAPDRSDVPDLPPD